MTTTAPSPKGTHATDEEISGRYGGTAPAVTLAVKGGQGAVGGAAAAKKRRKQTMNEEGRDDRYWERRRKNNIAAKRSRDARRAKENQIAMRANFLERENRVLTEELGKARAENHLLRERLGKYEMV